MKKDLMKVMMHPIRIKIIQELSMKKEATTKQLQKSCGDCAQATLYRHIKALLDNDLIKVVSKNQVNGIAEKVYGINPDLNKKILKNPGEMTEDDYITLFTQFILSLLTDFTTYFNEEDALKNVTNNIGFSTVSLLLSDEELVEMSKELSQVILKRIHNEGSEGRKMRKFSTIVTTSSNEKMKS